MDVNSLPETVTRQRRGCDLNPGPSAPESSTLTTRLPSQRTDGRLCCRIAQMDEQAENIVPAEAVGCTAAGITVMRPQCVAQTEPWRTASLPSVRMALSTI